MIPKWHVRNISALNAKESLHRDLVRHLATKGLSLMKEWHSDIDLTNTNNLKMGFHKPKCTSINHLHMHMMVGKRKLKAML